MHFQSPVPWIFILAESIIVDIVIIFLFFMAKFPYYNSSHQQRNLDQRIIVIPPSSCKKMFGQDVWTHPPMVLLVMAQKIKLLPFSWDLSLTFFFVWRPFYIMSETLLSSLMVGRLFGLSWCPQGGGRVIITLQAVVRDCGRWLVIAPVLSLCRRRNVGYGRLSGMTQQGLLVTINDPDNWSE